MEQGQIEQDSKSRRVAVAGASGFVGRALLKHLCSRGEAFEVRALSRRGSKSAAAADSSCQRLKWVECDLFSLLQTEEVLQGVDCAYYLVHSMLPAANLNQGHFRDFDLILADNFARAAQKAGVKQIIYLGGLVPENEELSEHLQSRLEVERTLMSYSTPVTSFRASLIVGARGSSFRILKQVVECTPVIFEPPWIDNPCQPIFIDDAIDALGSVLDSQASMGRIYDLGGSEVCTYRDLIRKCSNLLSRKRFFLQTPNLPNRMVAWMLSMLTGAPNRLLFPLLESMRHSMVVRPEHAYRRTKGTWTKLDQALALALQQEEQIRKKQPAQTLLKKVSGKSEYAQPSQPYVSSLQRLPKPKCMDAVSVSKSYMRWLSAFFRNVIFVRLVGNVAEFRVFGLSSPLLQLERSPERSSEGRQLFYIRGGLLARQIGRGRLEFREVRTDKSSIIAGIFDFYPTLPWFIYVFTQAPFHAFVMASFGRFLRRLNDSHSHKGHGVQHGIESN